MLTDLQTPATGLIGKPPLKLIQEETEDEPLVDPNFVEEEEFGFRMAEEYSHHLCEAADAYGMAWEVITSLVQWIGDTYGEKAAGKAVGYATMEWDL
jgi:hypothetical protein